MSQKTELPITGDVVARADLKINTKGGSTTATLKKAIRERLGELGSHLTAAAVEFSTGQAMLLLTGSVTADAHAPVHVRRVGRNRFEIELETDGDEEVDEMTAAFLRLKLDQFKKGKLRLAPPITADQWRAEMAEHVKTAEAAREKAKRRIGKRKLAAAR